MQSIVPKKMASVKSAKTDIVGLKSLTATIKDNYH